MASFNKVILMGNLTRDVEVRYTPGGHGRVGNRLGGQRSPQRRQGRMGRRDDVRRRHALGPQAEIAGEYLTKGSPVLIEGRLKLDQWEKDGQKRSKLRVVAENMRMLGGKGGGGGGGGGSAPPDECEYGGDDDGPASACSVARCRQSGGRRGGSRGGSAAAAAASSGGDDDDIPF